MAIEPGSSSNAVNPREVETISLALSPENAQKLVLAQSLGELTLTLRGRFEKDEQLQLEPASIQQTLGIKQQVRYRRSRSFGVYGPGGF